MTLKLPLQKWAWQRHTGDYYMYRYYFVFKLHTEFDWLSGGYIYLVTHYIGQLSASTSQVYCYHIHNHVLIFIELFI